MFTAFCKICRELVSSAGPIYFCFKEKTSMIEELTSIYHGDKLTHLHFVI